MTSWINVEHQNSRCPPHTPGNGESARKQAYTGSGSTQKTGGKASGKASATSKARTHGPTRKRKRSSDVPPIALRSTRLIDDTNIPAESEQKNVLSNITATRVKPPAVTPPSQTAS